VCWIGFRNLATWKNEDFPDVSANAAVVIFIVSKPVFFAGGPRMHLAASGMWSCNQFGRHLSPPATRSVSETLTLPNSLTLTMATAALV
jgi:hypothetical protein